MTSLSLFNSMEIFEFRSTARRPGKIFMSRKKGKQATSNEGIRTEGTQERELAWINSNSLHMTGPFNWTPTVNKEHIKLHVLNIGYTFNTLHNQHHHSPCTWREIIWNYGPHNKTIYIRTAIRSRTVRQCCVDQIIYSIFWRADCWMTRCREEYNIVQPTTSAYYRCVSYFVHVLVYFNPSCCGITHNSIC